jgi:hypothetical protein
MSHVEGYPAIMYSWVFLPVLIGSFACLAVPQASASDELSLAGDKVFAGDYLGATLLLRKSCSRQFRSGDEVESVIYQSTLAYLECNLGNHLRALKLMDHARLDPVPPRKALSRRSLLTAFSGYRAIPALDELVMRIGDRRVVMINERHHIPRDRAFVLQLMLRLQKKGFRYFAAEGFYPGTLAAAR